jgi:anti-sigma-K factor RskA
MTNEAQPRETESHGVPPEDLALYALGALDASDLARIGKHLEDCASCRLELQRLNADIGAFALASAPSSTPPQRARDRLLAAIAGSERLVKGAPAASPQWSFAFRMVVAGILVAAVIFEWHDAAAMRRDNERLHRELEQEQATSAQAKAIAGMMMSRDTMRLTLVATNQKAQPTAHAIYSEKQACVLLTAHNLAPLGPGKMYELWLLPKAGAPVPAGMFQSDAEWNALMLHGGLPEGMEAKGFAITIEPEQGSAAPSQQPILVATAG